ncbi:MAG: hypothetical protein DRR19_01215 [Candidatus Parabeggiatoa sp. nov. 1]|nr:MAG: hypothetical protein DRR19_01215 [Gammaproteobacteria bacterium]
MKNPEHCDHGNSAPYDVLKNLHYSQAGAGRHKCTICAYKEGYQAGIAEGIRRAKEALARLKNK